MYLGYCRYHCFDRVTHIQLNRIQYYYNIENISWNLRIVHLVPVYVDGHVHVPGLEHVPPLEHTGEQTAKQMNL
jgi:hypothetical protein